LADLTRDIANAKKELAVTMANVDQTKKKLADLAQADPKGVKTKAKVAKLQATLKQRTEQVAAYEKQLADLQAKADEISKSSKMMLRAEVRPPPRPVAVPIVEAPQEADKIKKAKVARADDLKRRKAIVAAEFEQELERIAKMTAMTEKQIAAIKDHMAKIKQEIAALTQADPKGVKTKAKVAKLEAMLKQHTAQLVDRQKQLATIQAQAEKVKTAIAKTSGR